MEGMKAKINVTIEESLLVKLDAAVKTQKFRNRSHAVELGLMKLLQEA
jgi:Arc/MetJ-type ribon-helix-helix transcriptional regulator